MPTTTMTTTTTDCAEGVPPTTTTTTSTVTAPDYVCPACTTTYAAKTSLEIRSPLEKVAAEALDFGHQRRWRGLGLASIKVTDGNAVGSERHMVGAGPLAGKNIAEKLVARDATSYTYTLISMDEGVFPFTVQDYLSTITCVSLGPEKTLVTFNSTFKSDSPDSVGAVSTCAVGPSLCLRSDAPVCH